MQLERLFSVTMPPPVSLGKVIHTEINHSPMEAYYLVGKSLYVENLISRQTAMCKSFSYNCSNNVECPCILFSHYVGELFGKLIVGLVSARDLKQRTTCVCNWSSF